MSDYAQTDWVDNVTPVDAARMDNIEAGIEAAHNEAHAAQATADAAVPKSLVDAKGDLIVASAADVVGRLAKGTDGHVLTADAAQALGLKWAAAGGGGAVDYENAWAAGTPYTAGDVVVYNGVEYLAVNPSTGQTPPALTPATPAQVPLVTTLPASPFDGQTVDFTDSLLTPSYVWRFRYVAAAPSNKWKFVGGAPLVGEALGAVSTGSSTYVSLSGGPSVTVPVAGFYDIALGARAGASANLAQHSLISAKLGAAAAGDNESVYFLSESSTAPMTASKGGMRRSLAAGAVVEMVYRVGGSTTGTFDFRTLQVLPVAVG